MGKGLRKKTAVGLGWSFADGALNQGIRFIVGLILARMLSPHDYGLIGIALIFVSVLEDVIDGGFTNALIQKYAPTTKDYSTAFLTNIILSLLLYALLFLSSPLIAAFFKEDQLVSLVRVISIILFIDALVFVPRARLIKKMDFKVQTKISFSSNILSAIVGIAMAVGGFGVWALVGQQLSRHLLQTILFWMASKWDIPLVFSRESFNSLFSFGSKLLLSDFINSVYRQLYQIVIGKFYHPVTLGYYTRAHQFSSLFSLTFTQMVQKVSFPALSSIQDNEAKMLSAYKMLIKSAMYVDFICMLVLAASARPMVVTLVGEKWLPAVPYLQILCFSMLLYPLHAINLNMLKVKGRSDLFLKLEILKKIIGLIPLTLGIFVGIYWMLIGSVVENLIGFFINSYYSRHLIGYGSIQQILDLMPSLLLAITVSVLTFLLAFLPFSDYVVFPLQVVMAVALTIGLSEITRIEPYLEIKKMATNYISSHIHRHQNGFIHRNR